MRRLETVTTCDVCGAEDRREDVAKGPQWHCVEVRTWVSAGGTVHSQTKFHVCDVCMVKVREALGVSDEG